jgi:hypothetical protein
MIDKEVIKTMMAAVAGVIRDHVSAAVVPLTQRFEEYEKRLDAIRIPEAIKGDPGESIRGEKGEAGPSAYEIAKELGFSGSPAEWLESLKGSDGVTIRGEKGEKGDRGDSGESVKGERGERGESIPGPKGDDGRPGLSAYDIAIEEGFRGSKFDWLQSLKGLDGVSIRGEKGDPGNDGKSIQGERGPAGESIHEDTIRLMIRKEIDEVVARIPRPQDGRSGEPGRDAAQIDILPAIDSMKSVPRGTYAFHDGGLIRSRRQTTVGETLDLNEWDVIVRGVSGIEFKQDTSDERRFTVNVRLSDGETKETHFRIPVLAFRDVFKEGTVYERGDVVRWDHSSWHCSAEKTKGTPGISPDWKLLVKRGDRGRDGKDIEATKPQGPIRLNGGGR